MSCVVKAGRQKQTLPGAGMMTQMRSGSHQMAVSWRTTTYRSDSSRNADAVNAIAPYTQRSVLLEAVLCHSIKPAYQTLEPSCAIWCSVHGPQTP